MLLSLVLFNTRVTAQQLINPGPVVSHIAQLEGQPLQGVKQIIEDQSGFMWLATNQGLLRFDGQQIKRFRHQADNPNSLAHNDIRGMVEDEQGHLWLITRGGGLSRFIPQTEQFSHFRHHSGDMHSLDSNQLNSIALGHDHHLWIGSNLGINHFNRKTLSNTRLDINLQPANQQNQDSIQQIYQDKQQRLWFSVSRKGLYLYPHKTDQLLHFDHHNQQDHHLDSNAISAIYETRDGELWIGTALSINRFNADSLGFERFEIPLMARNKANHASVTSIYQDRHNKLWVGTFYNGISVLHPDSQQLVNINPAGFSHNSLNVLQINDIFQDSSGVLWFVTPKDGLLKLNSSATLFSHHLTHPTRSTQPHPVNALYQDHCGQMWAPANNHLYQYDTASQQFKLIQRDIGPIKNITQLDSHALLLNIEGTGIRALALADGQLSPVAFGLNALDIQQLQASPGALWLTHGRAKPKLLRFDLKTKALDDLLPQYQVEKLYLFNQYLWVITTHNGIHRRPLDQNQWQQVVDNNIGPIHQIVQDRQQQVWLATQNAGLAQWRKNDGLRFYTTAEGLLSNEVTSIVEDDHGILWLGTNTGIAKFDATSAQFSHYDQHQGIRLQRMTAGLSGHTPDNIMMVGATTSATGSLHGILQFSPSQLATADRNPISRHGILFTDLKLFNQSVALQSVDPTSPLTSTINQTTQLILDHRQNWFSIAFASGAKQHSDNIRFSYKMQGLSDQWITMDAAKGIASFTSVAPGDYVFTLKLSAKDGSWADIKRHLKITLTPVWWQSNLAYAVYGLSTMVLIWFIYLLRTRALRQRARQLEQGIAQRTIKLKQQNDTISGLLLDKEALLSDKDRLIANISHEFRTPLTLILGPLAAAIDASDNAHSQTRLELAQANAQRLLHMVDQLLDLARLKNPAAITHGYKEVIKTARFMVESFKPLAQRQNIKLTFCADEQQPIYIQIQPDGLEKILSNLLSNAFKYCGDHQSVTLEITTNDHGQVKISVKDSGQGISEQDQKRIFKRFTRLKQQHHYAPGSGIGLALIKELIEQHQGHISVDSQPGHGCTFTVTLPIATIEAQNITAEAVNQSLIRQAITTMASSQSLPTTQAALQPQSLPQATTAKPSLLIIEDNQDMRHYIIDCLSSDYHCTQASDGLEGVNMAKERLPDLIISDVMMPKMDGFAVTAQLKNHHGTNHIPIVLLSARGDRESRIKGWSEQADEFIEKPFSTVELLARIKNLLLSRQMLSQKFQQTFEQAQPQLQHKTQDEGDLSAQAEPDERAATANPIHQQFFAQVNQVLSRHYADAAFDVAQFAIEMALSHRQFGRKMKALMNMTPAQSLRHYRLNQAATLLKQGVSPSVVYYKVGFATHSYFSQSFKARYQCLPSNYYKKSA